jgi:hypothetical protein
MAFATKRRLAVLTVVLASVAAAGCAGGGGGSDAGSNASLPSGRSCQDVRRELDKMDARGVPSRIEAANAGKKLAPAQREEVDTYNALLQQYLGARCHM